MDLRILEVSLGAPVAQGGFLVGHLFRYGENQPAVKAARRRGIQ